MTSFNDCASEHRDRVRQVRHIALELQVPAGRVALNRTVERFPYVPSDPAARDIRCFEAYNIQVQGLAKRLSATGITKVVIGISGGLDSTHALIVFFCSSLRRGSLTNRPCLGSACQGGMRLVSTSSLMVAAQSTASW